jgi:hypothetical protein
VPNPRFIDGLVNQMRSLSGARGIRTTVSSAAGGDTTVTPRGQGIRCLEVGHVTYR